MVKLQSSLYPFASVDIDTLKLQKMLGIRRPAHEVNFTKYGNDSAEITIKGEFNATLLLERRDSEVAVSLINGRLPQGMLDHDVRGLDCAFEDYILCIEFFLDDTTRYNEEV